MPAGGIATPYPPRRRAPSSPLPAIAPASWESGPPSSLPASAASNAVDVSPQIAAPVPPVLVAAPPVRRQVCHPLPAAPGVLAFPPPALEGQVASAAQPPHAPLLRHGVGLTLRQAYGVFRRVCAVFPPPLLPVV